MRAGKNVWVRYDMHGQEAELVKATEDPGEGWYPKYPAHRIRGDSYEYYEGRSAWERQANDAMAAEANDNFRKR